jgi:hypothetical protein
MAASISSGRAVKVEINSDLFLTRTDLPSLAQKAFATVGCAHRSKCSHYQLNHFPFGRLIVVETTPFELQICQSRVIDTSAFYALVSSLDNFHTQAKSTYERLLDWE